MAKTYTTLKYKFARDNMEVDVDHIYGRPFGITLNRRGKKPLFISKVLVKEMAEKIGYKNL